MSAANPAPTFRSSEAFELAPWGGPGALIVVDGVDGAGKSSLIESLSTAIENAVVTRQPTDWYRNLREFQEYVLDDRHRGNAERARRLAKHAALDRLRHVQEVLLPNLLDGKTVICDRYLLSSLAYFTARGVGDLSTVWDDNRFAITPDLQIFLDLDPAQALSRVVHRDGASTKSEEQDMARMSQVRNAYLSWFPVVPARMRAILDAARPLSEVHSEALSLAHRVTTKVLS